MTKGYQFIQSSDDPNKAALQWMFEHLKDIITFSEEEKKAISETIDIRTLKKGTILLREGEFPTHCYFVLRGCIRKFYLVDGLEKTTTFYLEGESVNSMISQEKKVPSTYYLECLEDTIVSAGSEASEADFFERFPRFETICRVQTEEKLGELEETLAQYMISTPEQRYLSLLQSKPELLDRVPQYHLASYIGVKPESLSRIRKRILQRHQS